MKLATFNLLHGMPVLGAAASNGDRPTGPPEVDEQMLADAVAHLGADVLGIQEVDVDQARSGGLDQVAVVAKAMGATSTVFAPTVLGTPGEEGWLAADDEWLQVTGVEGVDSRDDQQPAMPMYGVGLVSRWPIRRFEVVRFGASRGKLPLLVPADPRPQVVRVADEPRAAIAAVVATPHFGDITVVTAHLSFVPFANARQLRELVRRLEYFPRPVVILGDFNLPGKLPKWVTGWKSLATGATYPSLRPTVQFDHALADGVPPDVRTHSTVHALKVSDHCALSVTFSR